MSEPAKLKCSTLQFRQSFLCLFDCRPEPLLQMIIFNYSLLLQLCIPGEHWIVPERWEVVISFMNSYSTCFSTDQAFDHICNLFCRLIISSCSSCFTSFYMTKWKEYFPGKELLQPPHFDAEVLCYPKPKIVCDYLSWRQAECELFLLQDHILANRKYLWICLW